MRFSLSAGAAGLTLFQVRRSGRLSFERVVRWFSRQRLIRSRMRLRAWCSPSGEIPSAEQISALSRSSM
jgi:hypothetical protein